MNQIHRLIFRIAHAILFAGVAFPAAAQIGVFMDVSGGPVHMQIASAPAGFEPAPVEDRSTTLQFTLGATVSTAMKITVETTAPGQRFGLDVSAGSPSAGSSTGFVGLTDGMQPADLVRDVLPIGLLFETELVYRGTATLSQGAGMDQHVVIYSITEQ